MFWIFMDYMKALAIFYGIIYLTYKALRVYIKDYLDIDEEKER